VARELRAQVEAFWSAIDHPRDASLRTVVYDLPAVLDDLFNVGDRCAHDGAAFRCGSPMRGGLVVGRRPENHWTHPSVRQAGAERRLSQSAAPGCISMPPITNNP